MSLREYGGLHVRAISGGIVQINIVRINSNVFAL